MLRAAGGETSVQALCKLLEPGVRKISAAATKLIRSEVRNEAAARRDRLIALGASDEIVRGLVRLYELDGVFGIAALGRAQEIDELGVTRAYTRLGEALGLDWAQQQVARFVPADQWERLLTAGLARDFEQLRIEFLSRCRGKELDECGRRLDRGISARASISSGNWSRARAKRRACERADARADRGTGANTARPLDAHRRPRPGAGLSGALALGLRRRGRSADGRRREGRTGRLDRAQAILPASTSSFRSSPGAITSTMRDGSISSTAPSATGCR